MPEQTNIKYQNTGQVGAMGDNAQVEILTQSQGGATTSGKELDYSLLLHQLKELRQAIDEEPEASQDEKDQAIAAIHNAKEAAAEKNPSRVYASLKKAGGWVLGLSERVGTNLVASMIKDGLHHP